MGTARGDQEKKSLHASEQDRPDIQAARRRFRRRARRYPASKLIFVDEFGTDLGMTRRYARAPRDQRAVGSAPDNPDPHVTLVMGLGLRGVVAPFRFEGAMDGHTWDQYVREQLLPRLHKGDIVVVDGLGAHRTRGSRQSAHERGVKYWVLPGYSPDFSPVENAGGKVKAQMRGDEARERSSLDRAMKKALGRVSRSDARQWFRLKGYLPLTKRGRQPTGRPL